MQGEGERNYSQEPMFKIIMNEVRAFLSPTTNIWVVVATLAVCTGFIWNSNWIMYQDLRHDYNRAIKIIERIEDSGVTAVEAGSNVKEAEMTAIDLSETSATPCGNEGVISPSTDWEGTVEVSAYNAMESQTDSDPFTMASGKKVYDGAIACPRHIELGKKIELEGLGVFICEDRMNVRYLNNIDIFMWDYDEAINFGRQDIRFKIVG